MNTGSAKGARARTWATLLIAMLLAGIGATACGSDGSDSVAPAAFVNPATGQTECRWVNTPHECDGTGLAPTAYPIPIALPVQQPGMSATDFLILSALFQDGLRYHSFYYRPGYYDDFIRPAYSRYPGYVAYGYGHQPLTRINNVNVYKTTIINPVDTRYASQERAAQSRATYTSPSGKTYTGSTVPTKLFSGGNVPTKAGGSAGSSTSSSTTSGSGKSGYTGSSSSGSSGKNVYSGSSSGRSGGSSSGRSR